MTVKAAIGVVHGEKIDGWFLNSLIDLCTVRMNDAPANIGDYVLVRSGPLLAAGRGQLAGTFLEHTDADVLITLDSDMVFNPLHVYQLIDTFLKAQANDPDVGVVGGLAFISNHPRLETPVPNIWVDHPKKQGHTMKLNTYPQNSLVEVASTGGACLAIDRKVLQHFADNKVNAYHHLPIVQWPLLAQAVCRLEDPDEIAELIRQAVWDADQYGEDMSFCMRVREAGWKIMLHTGIIFDHSKSTLLGEREYLRAVNTSKESS